MKRPLTTWGVGAGVLLVVALAGCGDDDPASEAGPGPGPGDKTGKEVDLEDVVKIDGPEAAVRVIDNNFEAENIEVALGTKVVWTNAGRQDHDIIPADEAAGWGVEPTSFAPDAVYEYTFEQPGTYRYYCSLHGTTDSGMIGAVVVKE